MSDYDDTGYALAYQQELECRCYLENSVPQNCHCKFCGMVIEKDINEGFCKACAAYIEKEFQALKNKHLKNLKVKL